MPLYLAVAPGQLDRAKGWSAAHMAYHLGEDSHLLAQPLPAKHRGGLMMLSDLDAPPLGNPQQLGQEIVQECRRREFSGLVLDFESPPTAQRIALIHLLDALAEENHLRLFVPEHCALHVEKGTVLICTALSGGTLRERLERAAARYTPQRVALDCQRLSMDFLLPAPRGVGTPVSLQQLEKLRRGRSVYFSEALCARYFTYCAGNLTHFVLFDDADTLRRKVQLGAQLGIDTAFFMLPEVDDLLEELARQ